MEALIKRGTHVAKFDNVSLLILACKTKVAGQVEYRIIHTPSLASNVPRNKDLWMEDLLPMHISVFRRDNQLQSFIEQIHSTDTHTGTQIMTFAIAMLKKLGVYCIRINDGSSITLEGEKISLSVYRILEKGCGFYSKFGFKYTNKDFYSRLNPNTEIRRAVCAIDKINVDDLLTWLTHIKELASAKVKDIPKIYRVLDWRTDPPTVIELDITNSIVKKYLRWISKDSLRILKKLRGIPLRKALLELHPVDFNIILAIFCLFELYRIGNGPPMPGKLEIIRIHEYSRVPLYLNLQN